MPSDRALLLQDMLRQLDASKRTAYVLSFFVDHDSGTVAEIVSETGLAQSQVSIALADLRGKGWLDSSRMRRNQGTRGAQDHRLFIPVDDIVKEFVCAGRSHVEGMASALAELAMRSGRCPAPFTRVAIASGVGDSCYDCAERAVGTNHPR